MDFERLPIIMQVSSSNSTSVTINVRLQNERYYVAVADLGFLKGGF